MKVDKRIKRLVINVTDEEHQRIKVLAAKKNTTISKMVMQSLVLFVDKVFPKGN